MRSAHLVGPSPDGGSLVLTTDDGDELTVVVDDRLRDAVREVGRGTPRAGTTGDGTAQADRPRPGRLENAMETSLSPRDIQMRVRAGESLEDVAEVAGLAYERVERFAAPVLAEREHLALMALAASVRRRGETAGHRTLRATVADRLLKRGVDADAVVWDSYRLEDGRWAVTAGYAVDGEDHRATFTFDQRGRYSVPADDEARWLIGEQPPAAAGRRRADAADEPTIDLSDELALVRATQEADARTAEEPAPLVAQDDDHGDDERDDDEPDGHDGMLPGALATEAVLTEVVVERTEVSSVRSLRAVVVDADDDTALPPEPARGEATAEPADEPATHDAEPAAVEADDTGELTTLYAMLGSDGYSEDSPRVYAGLTDAAAVPETLGGGWEPAIVIDYPVEPSPADEAELPAAEHPDRTQVPMDDKAPVELTTPVDPGPPPPDQLPGTDEPAPPYARTDEADRAEEAEEFQLESEPPPEKKAKRKRAAVPSWDEIMFGGPKPGS
ncbi:Protein of unknown function [Friedmanniella luteola]|uniref:DUF3071 domain-containing protein n=1 Tax=Friedmanniella luteola TaxID=546871 RepID=A0A1H1RZG1_9ACTN|nr:septation protein SepH [Friedmanniella luteola]SDS41137.1 Protein of unknown function [Friedmanniella luteola]